MNKINAAVKYTIKDPRNIPNGISIIANNNANIPRIGKGSFLRMKNNIIPNPNERDISPQRIELTLNAINLKKAPNKMTAAAIYQGIFHEFSILNSL